MGDSFAVDSVELAKRIRVHTLRMTRDGKSSHIGSIFSVTDILAVLYSSVMRVRPEEPRWENRDRLILSKGHAGAGVYAALAERGFFDRSILAQHCQDGSILSGHVSHKGVSGVEFSTGSLGHGLGVACGMALGIHLDKQQSRVFCVLSDGECDEGSVWEAAMFAGHHQLRNLIAVVDYNGLQSLASVSETLELEPFADKWASFGWRAVQVDGHDHASLMHALNVLPSATDRPTVVLAKTTKGKGVSFMEDSILWHYRSPQGHEYDAAMSELGGAL